MTTNESGGTFETAILYGEGENPSGELLREIRKDLRLSQLELAVLTGVDRASIAKGEAGQEMRVSTLKRLVEALGGDFSLTAVLPSSDLDELILDARRGSGRRGLGRGYRASFATEWTQSLRKSQRWQKLVSGANAAASMPDAAACTSAAKVSAPDAS